MIIGTIEHGELGALSIATGLTDKHIEQLIYYANSDAALRTTSDPKRFKDKESFNIWLQKGRTIYVLTNSDGDLLGVMWFGGKEMPAEVDIPNETRFQYGVTFAIRTYGLARGKHLANTFMDKTFAAYKQTEEYNGITKKGIWLETSANNIPAVKAYTTFGFQHIAGPDEHGRILMVLPK